MQSEYNDFNGSNESIQGTVTVSEDFVRLKSEMNRIESDVDLTSKLDAVSSKINGIFQRQDNEYKRTYMLNKLLGTQDMQVCKKNVAKLDFGKTLGHVHSYGWLATGLTLNTARLFSGNIDSYIKILCNFRTQILETINCSSQMLTKINSALKDVVKNYIELKLDVNYIRSNPDVLEEINRTLDYLFQSNDLCGSCLETTGGKSKSTANKKAKKTRRSKKTRKSKK